MKLLLCAIAKNEERYIDEWINYHLKLGFTDVAIFMNNWRFENDDDRVIKIEFDTNDGHAQNQAYNTAIKLFQNKFDWIAFFDIDEFLTLKKHCSLETYLQTMQEFDAIGFNWRIFGDSGLKERTSNSVLDRFTKCQSGLNKHIKTIINTNKIKNNYIHECCHCTLRSLLGNSTVNSAGMSFIRGPFNENNHKECLETGYLNHYRNKTLEECIEKCRRNQNGIQNLMDYMSKFDEDFKEYNMNEVEDTTAKDFFHEE